MKSSVTFDDLTVLVGRNDAGKSSILDALNIFFNDAEIEKEDACVHGNASMMSESPVFSPNCPVKSFLMTSIPRPCKKSI